MERSMFIVRWIKYRESSQEERDLLYEKWHDAHNYHDSTYTVDAATVKGLEEQLTGEEKKQFARLLKSLHKLVEKEGEAFIVIS